MSRAWLLILLLAAFAPVSAAERRGPSGRVLDAHGTAIPGAKACLVVTGAEDLCVGTDAEGRYALPASDAVSVRVTARGFLPLNVAAVPQESPLVLERAAALLVRVVDAASGAGIDASKVRLVYSSGRQFGPLPANRAGLSLATLPPGEIVALATAEGYLDGSGAPATLVAGRKLELTITLTRTTAGR